MRELSFSKCKEIRAEAARATASKTEWLNEQRDRDVLQSRLNDLDQKRYDSWVEVVAEERRARIAASAPAEDDHSDFFSELARASAEETAA